MNDTARVKKWKKSKVAKRKHGYVHDAPHGTVSGYNNWGCRCDECTIAWREYKHSRRRAGKLT